MIYLDWGIFNREVAQGTVVGLIFNNVYQIFPLVENGKLRSFKTRR